jgi:hypothetical protein
MTFVEPPPGGAARFGLLEAASVVTATDGHALLGVDYTPVCGKAHLTVGACVPMPVEAGEGGDIIIPKTVDDGVTEVAGDLFAVYHLFSCRPVGIDIQARARASFELAEGMAVEEWFAAYITAHTLATDLTPAAGAVTPQDGLATLEAWAGANYGGAPVFHGDRGLASLLASTSQVTVVGGRLQTALGGAFAAGGGYLGNLGDPDGQSQTPDDEGWLYVTGPVGFWRSDILTDAGADILQNHQAIIGATNPPGHAGTVTNESRVLVERAYVGATSCIVGAIRVIRSACCPEPVVV